MQVIQGAAAATFPAFPTVSIDALMKGPPPRPVEDEAPKRGIDAEEMHQGILEALPHLRAFAHLLARDRTLAEDLVQDTIVRALTCRHQFAPGTNLRGWLTVILRNRYFNELRRRSRKAESHVEFDWGVGCVEGGQEEQLKIRDFKRAFAALPDTQREALLLVGASGLSYDEAAAIIDCPVGTIKSRVSRARLFLEKALEGKTAAPGTTLLSVQGA
ncbi:MAG TPA: sigma-70 family RNA polymerase sigma factor [Stellaceae bacterium]|jgi:RNA polymerase sigma-70 factor (ECF subfamily)|nr:sigma-70 family RNA polymerase sigma factor [Stellaceae bacterium]